MIAALIFAGVIAVDQIVKYVIRAGLMPGESLPIVPGFFRLTFVRNEGAAFSMFENNTLVTVGLTSILIILCILVFSASRRKGSSLVSYCMMLIIAGGVSNLFDRLCFGYVTDMFSFGSFAVFNVADIAIVAGCLLTMLIIITGKEEI